MRDVFGEALMRPPAQRASFIAEACGDDAGLRSEIEALLESDATADEFLEPPTTADSTNLLRSSPTTNSDAASKTGAPAVHVDGYRMLRQIHRGGQGVVYHAVQESTGRDVAIKVMHEGLLFGSRDRVRFEREVRILGQLNHPNIVTIHDSGSVAGGLYLVMDYIRGKPLDKYIADTKPAVDDVLCLFAGICEAVNVAHLRGVIHRDLKPGNIRIDPAGRPHVLDFGLAKVSEFDDLAGSQSEEMTITGQFVGSIPWASPEQTAGSPDKIDLRTDVYSLGVLLYQMLTDRFPYPVTGSVRDIMDNIAVADPLKPSSLRPEINSEVETMVLKCLAKEPERRYQSAGDVARDIRRYLGGEAIEAKRDSGWYVLRKSVARHRVAVTVACLFVLLTVASTVALGVLYRSANTQRALAEQSRQDAEDRAIALERSNYFNTIALAQNAVEDENTLDLVQLLKQCPPGLRGWEWRYLKRRSDTSVRTLSGHENAVGSVVFSPDGTMFASGSQDGTIRLWDSTTGAELRRLTGHQGWNTSITFSPDGSQLAAACLPAAGEDGSSLRIWDAHTGNVLRTLSGHDGPVQTSSYSPDGLLIATGSRDKTIKVWDIKAGRVLKTLRGHKADVSGVAWMPDGRRIVSGSWDGTVTLWDSLLGESLYTLAHDDRVVDVAIHPDGTKIASSSWDKTIRVWDADDGELLRLISCGTANPHGIAFSPTGNRLAAATDTALKIWQWETRRLELIRFGHLSAVKSVDYSPDGRRIISGSDDMTIRVWRTEPREDPPTLRGHTDMVRGVAVSGDGERIISGGRDSVVRVWNARSCSELMVLRGHSGWVEAVAVSSDGRRIVSGGFDRTVRIWDASSGALTTTLKGHGDAILCVGLSPNDRWIASGSMDGTIGVWDAETGELVRTLSGHADGVYAVAFSPDGRRMLSGGVDRRVKVWDATTGRMIRELSGHTAAVLAVVFSPDGGLIASGSTDRTIRLWDSATGRSLHELKGHAAHVQSLAFSPDGKRLVSGGFDHLVKVWDVESAKPALSLSGHAGPVLGLAFSPDGNWFVSASSDKTLRIWDAVPNSLRYRQ